MTQDLPGMPESDPVVVNHDEERFIADFLKHITTLSTGSLLILVSVLDKLFPQPEWKFAVAVSVLSFLATIFCSAILYWIRLTYVETKQAMTPRREWFEALIGFILLLSFLLALTSLTVFFLRNFFA